MKESLVILTPGFPDGEQDTICMPYIQMFVKALRSEYPTMNIQIISFQYPYEVSTMNWYGCTVHCIGGRNRKWNRWFTWKKAKQLFRSIHSHHEVKGILSLWLNECTYIGQQISKTYGIPQVAWALGQDVKKENSYIRLIDFSKLTTVCVSPFSMDQLKLNHGIDTLHILSNGLHLQSIPAPSTREKQFDLISVGSMSAFKQFEWVVDCVNELKSDHPNIRACMIGDGEEFGNIQRKITELHLETHIELKGVLPHHECLDLMMCSRVLLHPSSFEGASTVVLEALYYKCRVISITVPHAPMPETFFMVNSYEEMKKKTREALSLPDNEHSYCVNTSEESARELIRLFEINANYRDFTTMRK